MKVRNRPKNEMVKLLDLDERLIDDPVIKTVVSSLSSIYSPISQYCDRLENYKKYDKSFNDLRNSDSKERRMIADLVNDIFEGLYRVKKLIEDAQVDMRAVLRTPKHEPEPLIMKRRHPVRQR